ncbi:thermonuclease family protein [archaeon]|nr:thermonuclease family protein [archaeon]
MRFKTLLIVLILIFAISTTSFTGYFILSDKEKTYLVAKIIDGDTIDLKSGENVRLLGINAPEKNEFYYQEAKNRLIELVEGKLVKLESDFEDKDTYGRLLRYIFLDKTFVNFQMVKEGYATVYIIQPNEKYRVKLEEAEDEAKEKLLGIWNTSTSTNCISIINFHYNAVGNDNENLNDEYVVFKNKCDPINLNGWSVKDEATHIYTFKNFILSKDATFTLYSGSGSDTNDKLYWNSKKYAIWNNDGDTLYLRDNNGNLVLSYSYPT